MSPELEPPTHMGFLAVEVIGCLIFRTAVFQGEETEAQRG